MWILSKMKLFNWEKCDFCEKNGLLHLQNEQHLSPPVTMHRKRVERIIIETMHNLRKTVGGEARKPERSEEEVARSAMHHMHDLHVAYCVFKGFHCSYLDNVSWHLSKSNSVHWIGLQISSIARFARYAGISWVLKLLESIGLKSSKGPRSRKIE